MDYEQFYLDLTAANAGGGAGWVSEYSLLDHYNLPVLSASNLANLALDLAVDRSLFNRYYKANTVGLEEATAENCDSTCQQFHFCALYHQQYQQFEHCVVTNNTQSILI